MRGGRARRDFMIRTGAVAEIPLRFYLILHTRIFIMRRTEAVAEIPLRFDSLHRVTGGPGFRRDPH